MCFFFGRTVNYICGGHDEKTLVTYCHVAMTYTEWVKNGMRGVEPPRCDDSQFHTETVNHPRNCMGLLGACGVSSRNTTVAHNVDTGVGFEDFNPN